MGQYLPVEINGMVHIILTLPPSFVELTIFCNSFEKVFCEEVTLDPFLTELLFQIISKT